MTYPLFNGLKWPYGWLAVSCLFLALESRGQAGQKPGQEIHDPDTLRTVILDPVQVHGRLKDQQQTLSEFFKSNPAASTEDILGRLPEMSLIRRGSYGMEPVIRNASGPRIQVLLDGMKIHGACTDKMDPPTIYIEPDNLSQIQVATGGNGFLMGSSTGGMLNMQLAMPDCDCEKTWSGSVSSGFQSAANAWYEGAVLQYSSAPWAVRLSGTYRKSGDYRAGGGDRIPFSQYEKANFSASVLRKLKNGTALKADLLADDGWNIGYPALPMDVGLATARIAALSWSRSVPDGRWLNWEAKIYANQVHHNMDDTHRPFVPMHMDMPGNSETEGAYAQGTLLTTKNQRLFLRADASSTFLKASMTMYQRNQTPMYMLTWPDNRNNQAGLGARWSWQSDSLNRWVVNLRTDLEQASLVGDMAKGQVEVFGYPVGPRFFWLKNVSAQWLRILSPRLQLGTTFGYSERAPGASELYGMYLFSAFDGYDYVGDPLLKPEQSLNAEARLSYHRKKWKMELAGYSSRTFQYIMGETDPSLSTMTVGARGVKVYRNLTYADIMGFEWSMSGKAGPHTEVIHTLRYSYARDGAGNALPMIAPLKTLLALRETIGQVSLQVEAEAAAAQHRVSRAAGEQETPGYFLLHARLQWPFLFSSLTGQLSGGVENLFDRNYREHLDWGNIPRPGQNFYLQVQVGF